MADKKDPLERALSSQRPGRTAYVNPQYEMDTRANKPGILNWDRGNRRDESSAINDATLQDMRASDRYSKGGMVKAGSPKMSAKCGDTKVIKCS